MPTAATLRVRPLHMLCGLLLGLGLATSAGAQDIKPLGQGDLAWLRRDGFGLDSQTIARYEQLGRRRFLDRQLAGDDDSLPPAIRHLLDSYTVVNTPPDQLLVEFRRRFKSVRDMPAGDAKNAAKKALLKTRRQLFLQDAEVEMLHAVYGGNQLKEQMVWFWLNHFSVYAPKGPVGLFATDYEDRVIRPHALGKFKDLVMAVLQSPAMLVYLDNVHNVKSKTNENYARELMELHTLGVGSGYTQQDVQQLMAILTGAGIAPFARPGWHGRRMRPGFVRDGMFVFNPNKHDFSNKVFLGHTIRGSGYDEIEQAIDLIVRQPACAHFISQQLAEYFVADKPPPALVDAMARTFQHSDGDIAAVLRTLFTSKAVTADYGRKFKDPFRFVVSSMRLAYDGQPIRNAAPLVNWVRQMGEAPYGRITPDGWPLDSASWSGSGQMAKRFVVARAIGSGHNRLFDPAPTNSPDRMTPMTPHMPPTIQNTALFRASFAPHLSAATRKALAQARSPQQWNTYLLSSPDFNER
ncbi:DUF1800 domain-containing protein [Dyella sp. A6]|uniref:DUF1800 domain-containing protein n=1 Tax=Dyella aluminiiresistens TaxID=3069105 RepID=UPI002E789583|nr:DUF1800 domain-containing protein [Dyella sp. A6]